MKPSDITAYLGASAVALLGATEKQLIGVASRAPNVPTAAIWLMQACGVKPTADHLKRWSDDCAKLSEPKPAKKSNPVKA